MKYIILQETLGKDFTVNHPIIFPDSLVHADVAKALRTGTDRKNPLKPVSAGFIHLDVQQTYGESVTLDLDSRSSDASLINGIDYSHGIDSGDNSVIDRLMDDLKKSIGLLPKQRGEAEVEPQPATLAHLFTHQVTLPAYIPMDLPVPRMTLRRCYLECQKLLALPSSHPMHARTHVKAKLAMLDLPLLSQSYLFHAYQVAALSEWDNLNDKVGVMNLITLCQSYDVHDEIRGQVFRVNSRDGTVTTHSWHEAKDLINRRIK